MLTKLGTESAGIKILNAHFPAPFVSGLEYSAPARGTWNIVHTGMLLPESHQIFVCAQGCLRGVVLTAAEMGATERFSTIAIRENNVLDGDMENLITGGVADILQKLPYRPRAVLLFTSCIHHFIGCDTDLVFKRLNEQYTDIKFVNCFMNPIMRKSGLTPDQLMRKQLYRFLEKRTTDSRSVNIIGNNFATDTTSELVTMLQDNGFILRDITLCDTYEAYEQMAESFLNITYNAAAVPAGFTLKQRLSQTHLHLPLSFSYSEITQNLHRLADALNINRTDFTENIARCEAALKCAKEALGNAPIVIDYTATLRPLSLARLLLEHEFNVTRIFADSFTADEQEDFAILQRIAPELQLLPTTQPIMRFAERSCGQKTLAIGQKAAYFTGTNNFVNIVENGGMYGFDGIVRMSELMVEAFMQEKDTKTIIQAKGLGCGCCL